MADKIAEASTIVPGTDATVWVATGAYASVPWVTGMSWVVGGPYATNPFNLNGRNVFMGCYAESGQQPVQATAPSGSTA